MEQLHNGFTLALCDGAFPLSTDSIALSGFVKLPRKATVLDLGSGCGTLGLLLCANSPSCHVTGIEINEKAHLTALENARVNHIADRLTSICGNLQTIHRLITPGGFSLCVSNPPYFSGGIKSATLSSARQEELCTLDTVIDAANWGLKYGGDFYIVHRPERLAELFTKASSRGLEPKELLLLRHKENGPVSLVLVHCRKGASPGLKWQEAFLHNKNGEKSTYYRNLYHI
jgi:tRNA1(Val) A37 N6-methylase TrmN6